MKKIETYSFQGNRIQNASKLPFFQKHKFSIFFSIWTIFYLQSGLLIWVQAHYCQKKYLNIYETFFINIDSRTQNSSKRFKTKSECFFFQF